MASTQASGRVRIESLDQFRGYTVAGMFLVNFLGGFTVIKEMFPILIHHHTYCSYADTIMPQFLFAVGFAFRLTFSRRIEIEGPTAAYGRVVRRLLGLALISIVIYTDGRKFTNWEQLSNEGLWSALLPAMKRDWFQTLMHIAATSLWVLPVITASAGVRLAFMLASAAAHVVLSYAFNFVWVNSAPNGIDGGPLGFLTWSIPLLVGTLACDAMTQSEGRYPLFRMFFWSLVLMGLGWLLSCPTRLYDVPPDQVEAMRGQKLAAHPVVPAPEQWSGRDWRSLVAEPPFVPPPDENHRKWNYWMMSQRAGTLSYLTFSAGFSLAVYAVFVIACDILGLRLGLFGTFGTNALVGYILHGMVGGAVKAFMTSDAPLWFVAAGFGLFFWITYVFVRHLEKNGIYLRM